MVQALGVDGVHFLQVEGAGHPADQVVRVGVLAAEDGVDLDELLLPLQGVQVVGHGQEVHFRRQLVGLVAPVAIGEDAQLSALHELLHAALHRGEVAGVGLGPGAQRLGQLRGGHGVGLEHADHVHPVQGVQVVEVHHVVLDELGAEHEVAHQLRVLGDGDAQGVLHRPHAGEGVHGGAHAADALGEGPGIAGIAALEDLLDAADHGAGAEGVRHDAILDHRLDAEMTLDAGDGINDDAVAHHSTSLLSGVSLTASTTWSWMSFRLRMFVETAWAATPTAAAAPRVRPTVSAVDSMPKPGKEGRCR